MSAAGRKPGCTCTARCGDCPGIYANRTQPCDMYFASENQRRLEHAAPELLALARQVAHLNPEAGEIGPGMLAHLVTTAQRLVLAATGSTA